MAAASMEPQQRQPSRFRTGIMIAAATAGLATAAVVYLRLQERRRRQRRAAQGGAGERAASLAEEIRAALVQAGEDTGAGGSEWAAEFQSAVAWVSETSVSLSTEQQLKLYGCYKQSLQGDAPIDCPRGIQASMKWEAWDAMRGVGPLTSMSQYVALLDAAAPAWRTTAPEDEAAAAESSQPGGGEGLSMGPSVSTMGRMGDPDEEEDVDGTPVGQLCQKIAEGDVEGACRLLQSQPSLALQADKDGMTPLHWACDRGEMKVMDALLNAVGQGSAAVGWLNACDSSGDTALHYALNTENVAAARLLVARGADVTVENAEGETPLALAEELGLDLAAS